MSSQKRKGPRKAEALQMLRPDGLVPNGVMAPEGGIDESVVAVVGTR